MAFRVNDLFPFHITKVDSNIWPLGLVGGGLTSKRQHVDRFISDIIDDLGKQSADAQGLGRPVTTALKLRNSSSHLLYMMKDRMGDLGRGRIIGLLKIGRKDLMLYNKDQKLCVVRCPCVLDFYIMKQYQRGGKGKVLFDFMLKDQNLQPYSLPVDFPAYTMYNFMLKHYGVELEKKEYRFSIDERFLTDTSAGNVWKLYPPAAGLFGYKPEDEPNYVPPASSPTPTKKSDADEGGDAPQAGPSHMHSKFW